LIVLSCLLESTHLLWIGAQAASWQKIQLPKFFNFGTICKKLNQLEEK